MAKPVSLPAWRCAICSVRRAEPRGECYSAAVNRLQSALMHDEMVAIVEAVPEFAAVTRIRTGSPAAPDRGDGRPGQGLEI